VAFEALTRNDVMLSNRRSRSSFGSAAAVEGRSGRRLLISGTSFATSDALSPISARNASSGRIDTYSRITSTKDEYGDADSPS
jgi:hypothetical protein